MPNEAALWSRMAVGKCSEILSGGGFYKVSLRVLRMQVMSIPSVEKLRHLRAVIKLFKESIAEINHSIVAALHLLKCSQLPCCAKHFC